jgi:TorA maturation chaperone TorD
VQASKQNVETMNREPESSQAVDLARECLYRFLSAAIADPYSIGWGAVFDEPSRRLASDAAALLRAEIGTKDLSLAFGELPPAGLNVDSLVDHLEGPRDTIRLDYDRIFGLVVPRECPPYETEYHRAGDAFFRAQQLADVAGFYRAFGVDPSASPSERPDHIRLELEFMALLAMKKRLAAHEGDTTNEEHRSVCADAECKFFAEHLAWWVPSFAAGLRRKAECGFYVDLADALAALVSAERSYLDIPGPDGPAVPSLIERPEEQSGCAGCAAFNATQ